MCDYRCIIISKDVREWKHNRYIKGVPTRCEHTHTHTHTHTHRWICEQPAYTMAYVNILQIADVNTRMNVYVSINVWVQINQVCGNTIKSVRQTLRSDKIGNSLLWNDKYLHVKYNCMTMIIFIEKWEKIVMICCMKLYEKTIIGVVILSFLTYPWLYANRNTTYAKGIRARCAHVHKQITHTRPHTHTHTHTNLYWCALICKQICIDTPKKRVNSTECLWKDSAKILWIKNSFYV